MYLEQKRISVIFAKYDYMNFHVINHHLSKIFSSYLNLNNNPESSDCKFSFLTLLDYTPHNPQMIFLDFCKNLDKLSLMNNSDKPIIVFLENELIMNSQELEHLLGEYIC